jgi:hypothetical protein
MGLRQNENLTVEQLIEEQYRGIRPAAGYPACPDHTEKWTLWKLLDAEKKHRHQADRKLRHVAGQQRERPLFRHPQSKYFRRGQARPRPGAVAWSLWEIYPPTSQNLITEFSDQADPGKADATFKKIVETAQAMEKADPDPHHQFGDLLDGHRHQ